MVAQSIGIAVTDEPAPPRYRIEHHTGGQVIVLSFTSAWDAVSTALAEYAPRLLAEHATGELCLIEQATGRVVAHRDLWPEG